MYAFHVSAFHACYNALAHACNALRMCTSWEIVNMRGKTFLPKKTFFRSCFGFLGVDEIMWLRREIVNAYNTQCISCKIRYTCALRTIRSMGLPNAILRHTYTILKQKDDAPQRGRRHNESSVSGGSSAVALRPLHKLLNVFSNIINVDQ